MFIWNKVAKMAEAAQNLAKHPTYTDLENVRGKKRLADVSFWLSIGLTVIFFFIGSIPNFEYWSLKLISVVGGGIAIYYLYRNITRFFLKVT